MNIIKYAFAFVLAYFAVDAAWVLIQLLGMYLSLSPEAHATGLIDYGLTIKKIFTSTFIALFCGALALYFFGVIEKDD